MIRSDLAYRRVTENVNKLMEELLGELTTEFEALLVAESKDAKVPAPQAALADLAELALKHGLTHGRVGPMSWLEFRDTPVGKSVNPDTRRPLSTTLFGGQDLDLYQPVLTVDIDGNRFIAMKMSDTPDRVPELAEVRNKVIRAWKLKKAAEFALKMPRSRPRMLRRPARC